LLPQSLFGGSTPYEELDRYVRSTYRLVCAYAGWNLYAA